MHVTKEREFPRYPVTTSETPVKIFTKYVEHKANYESPLRCRSYNYRSLKPSFTMKVT